MIVGKVIADKYKIIEIIRKHDFYDEYIAHDESKDIRVSLKWIKSELVDPGKSFKRIKPTLEKMSSIHHRGISTIRDFGEDESVYIVEDLNEHVLLTEIFSKADIINPLQGLNLGIKIVDSLEFAHTKNIVHGQLTPESIMITEELSPIITDFYILNILSSELRTSTEFQGRDIRYCAPESISSNTPTLQSDIYSVGVILYQLLTGKVPFEKENALSIALEKIQYEVKKPRDYVPEIPILLESIVLKCINKDLSLRYKNAGELLSELHLCRSTIIRTNSRQKNHSDIDDVQKEESVESNISDLSTTLDKIIVNKREESNVSNKDESSEKDKSDNRELDNSNEDKQITGEKMEPLKESNQAKDRKVPKGLIAFLLSFFVFLTVVFVIIRLVGSYFVGDPSVGTIIVPTVVGKSVVEAKALLGNKDLQPVIGESQNSDEIPKGYILTQIPAAGSKVKSGREINLIVSAGQQKATVPKLIGLTIEDAIVIMNKARLTVGEQRNEYSERYKEGFIIEQIPDAGEERYEGYPVNLVISKGKALMSITMPRVIDLPVKEAQNILEMNGISNIELKPVETNFALTDYVVCQNILEGTKVTPEQSIVLYYAKHNNVRSYSESKGVVKLKISTDDDPKEVVIFVIDEDRRREIYRKVHGPGDRVEVPVSGTGVVNVKVYIGGILLKETTL